MTAYNCPTSAFVLLLKDVLELGTETVRRGGEVKELSYVNAKIHYPTQRCYVLPGRNDNIFSKVAETLWVMAGRNDIHWLSTFLPRAKEFSDDGIVWRGGYGPRIRKWKSYTPSGTKTVDQLKYVVDLINENRYTRQAVISLWDPVIDTGSGKDIPCNNWLHFMVTHVCGEDYLNLHVSQRSADIMWGWSNINLFEWSVLLQAVAYWTNTIVGEIYYNVSNLHLYKKHYYRARSIVEKFPGHTMYDYGVCPASISTLFSKFDDALDKIFEADMSSRCGILTYYETDDKFLKSASMMMSLWHNWEDMTIQKICEFIGKMPIGDLRVATIEYLFRHLGYDLLYGNFLSIEELDAMISLIGGFPTSTEENV